MPDRPPVSWSSLIPNVAQRLGSRRAEYALDLVDCLLQFNPGKRFSAGEALSHPYLAGELGEMQAQWIEAEMLPAVQDDLLKDEILQCIANEAAAAAWSSGAVAQGDADCKPFSDMAGFGDLDAPWGKSPEGFDDWSPHEQPPAWCSLDQGGG